MKYIKYKKGYKYQIVEDYHDSVDILPNTVVDSIYITLDPNGYLTIKKGYSFDGPSGPTVDTKNFMRGSLVHDALYQLMREMKLNRKWRKQADKELYRDCRDDGMSWFRANYIYLLVRKFAGFSSSPRNRKKVITAPKSKDK